MTRGTASAYWYVETAAHTPTGQDDLPLVLTVAEAAILLRISRAFAYELVASGDLPAIRMGRRVVIPRDGLVAWLDARVAAPDPKLR